MLKRILNKIKTPSKTKTFFPQQRSFTSIKNPSYVSGTGSRALIYKTIPQQLRDITNQYPDNFAVCSPHEDTRLTYTELLERVETLAAGLLSLDFKAKRNARVGVFAPNVVDYYVAQMACSMADLILVNINPNYKKMELKYALKKVECEALLMVSGIKHSNYDEMITKIEPELKHNKPGKLRSRKLPDLEYVIKMDNNLSYPGFMSIDEIYEKGNLKENRDRVLAVEKTIKPEDSTNIQFTSGTTGAPKASTLSHFGILNNGWLLAERLRYTEKDKICCSVPLYHCFGMVISNLAAITSGSEVIFPSASFDPKASMQAISDYGITSVYGVPTMFIEYLKEIKANPEKYETETCRTGVMAGSLCPKPLMEETITLMNLEEMTVAYGMTETSPISFQNWYDDTFERKTQSVGTVLNHTECKLIDEEGRIVELGEPGEVLTRGYLVMKGYWNDPEATKGAIDKDGWMHTGDIGVLDNEGYLNIVGRSKDTIIRGGENVFPKEIEEYLLRLEDIENVQIFPVEDERLGEEIFAWVKKVEESDLVKEDIYEICKKNLAYFKVPKYVKFVDDFPITVTGKPQKFKMRDAMEAELDNDENAFEQYRVR